MANWSGPLPGLKPYNIYLWSSGSKRNNEPTDSLDSTYDKENLTGLLLNLSGFFIWQHSSIIKIIILEVTCYA
jgi:hypothetical protein